MEINGFWGSAIASSARTVSPTRLLFNLTGGQFHSLSAKPIGHRRFGGMSIDEANTLITFLRGTMLSLNICASAFKSSRANKRTTLFLTLAVAHGL